jgi:hypothetical protein
LNDIDRLIKGAIDMHLHAAPDTMSMRLDVLEAAQQAKDAGMKAIVFKNHHFPTTPIAIIVGKLVPDIRVFGGICLDYEVGGLNHNALKASAELGAKVAWMPTISAANGKKPGSGGCCILDDKGELLPEIAGILAIVKEYDMVLASGKLSPKEIFALFGKAKMIGIQKLVANHASNAGIMNQALSLEEHKQLAGMGAFLEHAAANAETGDFGQSTASIVKMIKSVGVEHCILCSDMGLSHGNPNGILPVEGLRRFIAALIDNGITAQEIELMIKVSPARLLGIS